MINTQYDTYKASIPSFSYGTTICYHILAIDSAINNNTSTNPSSSCISFEIKYNINNPAPLHYDAKLFSIESPINQGPSNTSTPVSIRIANKADTTLKKVQIGWELDGAFQNNQTWTGNLTMDQVSDTINLGNTSLNTGGHSITAWTFNPNDSLDLDLSNDTLSYSFYLCNEILNGTYTLGGANADFQSFNELIGILNNCGVNGPVTINVNPGIYTEQLLFKNSIPGVDSINTVLIKSVTNNADDVVVLFEPSGNDNYIVKFNRTEYITLDNITVKTNSESDLSIILIDSFSTNIIINSCKIISPISSTSSVFGIKAKGIGIENNLINNNEIIGGYNGIQFEGFNSYRLNKNTISNNRIFNKNYSGIIVFHNNNIIIENNNINITNSISNNYTFGIRLLDVYDYSIKKNNININLTKNGTGISIGQAYKSLSEGYADIINNSIIVGGNSTNSTVYGISTYSITDSRIIHNSVLVKTGGSLASAIDIGGTTSTIDIRNNIFANKSNGYTLKNASTIITSCDYNSYYTNGLLLTKWGSTTSQNSTGISAVKTASGLDTNSMVTDPKFYTANNLHSYSNVIDGSAIFISDITHDIDGEIRNTTAPDIGSDEFTIATIDAGVSQILNILPIDTQARTLTLYAVINNYGIDTITSLNVKYSLNGATAINKPWTGNLASGGSDTLNLGSITLPVLDFTVNVYTELNTDTIHTNDSLTNSYYALPLIEVQVSELVNQADGCDKSTNESVSISILNKGIIPIYNGITASYELNGNPVVTENVTDTIFPADSVIFTFSQLADLSTGFNDSTFTFNISVNHSSDPINNNDNISVSIISKGDLYPPIISDSTINYGSSISLNAISNSPVFWYANDSTTTELENGSIFTTPLLFDSTTYYVQASDYHPSTLTTIGFGTNTAGAFDQTIYGRIGGYGKYQILYTAAELTASGLSAGLIESIEFHVGYTFSTFGLTTFDIGMANVTETSLTSSFLTNSVTNVYSEPFTGITNLDKWYMHSFSTPFYWDGTSSLLIQICTQGSIYNAPKVYYSNTTNKQFLATQGGSVSCSTTTGSPTTKRPNIKINTVGTYGCTSPKVSVNVQVPPPPIDVNLASISQPTSGCDLGTTPVTINIVNNGTNTIPSGFTATYKINNNSYIAAETINTAINPQDTLAYTFTALASLPAGSNGTLYSITAKLSVSGDNYAGNDSLLVDSINSMYKPSNPITTDLTINYANSATLSAIHTDSLFWYSDSLGSQYLGAGNAYITDYLYSTEVFYAKEQVSIAQTNYTVGTSSSFSGTAGPSPYGADNDYGAKSQFLITASELSALGMMQGPIQSISFKVVAPTGAPLSNYEIRIGSTTRSSMLGTYLETNLTTVYTNSSYTDVIGWNEHILNTPFFWDGISNIIVETSFKNNAQVAFSSVNYTITPNVSVAYITAGSNFDRMDSVITSNSSNRPNIRINQTGLGSCASELIPLQVNIINQVNYDAGIIDIIEPVSFASSNNNSTIKVILKNYGQSNITSALIKITENNINITDSFAWTGNLAQNEIDTVIINNYNFRGGVTNLKVWADLTNDTIHMNDTATTQLVVCMSGQYTINSIDGDYLSFTAAANDLKIAGICGPVTFNVDSGTYNEQVSLFEITGSSSINTITFQSTDLDSSKVLLKTTVTSPTSNYVFRIAGASNIIIKNLGFESVGSLDGNIIALENSAHHIELSNNIFNCLVSTTTYSNASGIYTNDHNISDVIIKNNIFKNGNKLISILGNINQNNNFTIEDNQLNGFYGSGILVSKSNNFVISNNTITSGVLGTNTYGIYIYNSNGIDITKNNIILKSQTKNIGIYYTADGTSSNHSEISNNFISIVSSTDNEGIKLSFADYVDVYFNSVYISSASATSKAFYMNGTTNNNTKNNTFVTTDGYALYIPSVSSSIDVDYNNLFLKSTNATNFVYWGQSILDLTALKTIDPNNNQNAVSVYPNYISTTDLHAQQIDLFNSGIPINGITTDIDNESRNALNPCIGADEFIIPAIDLSLVETVYPFESNCGYINSDSIVVKVKNMGLNSIDFSTSNATISFYITGIVNDSIIYTINSGVLNTGIDTLIKISNTFDFSQNGNYIFNGSIYILNDGNSLNNPMEESNIVNYPNITSFPFIDDFESGTNLNFKEITNSQSNVKIDNSQTSGNYFDMHFEGGSGYGWLASTTVTQAFNNLTHIAKLSTCDIDAASTNFLQLQFKLKQTNSSSFVTTSKNSWFRVLLTDANNSVHYLKNINGDSVFTPNSLDQDPFINQIFNLNQYTGQNFQISFEFAGKYNFANTSNLGDNAYIDDIQLWIPTQADIAVNSVLSNTYMGNPGELLTLKAVFTNMGTDTLLSVPLAYQSNNGTIIRDTAIGVFFPNKVDTFTFSSVYTLALGNNNICVFSEILNDGNNQNDTSCILAKGLDTFTINYEDDFETQDNWYANPASLQWQLGTPNSSFINSAHSGQNAWATVLNGNHQIGSTEYLYSPYFIIPNTTDSAVLELWMSMNVTNNEAYSQIEYSFDNITWIPVGYIGDPSAINWYNKSINGNHYWSFENYAWNKSTIKLDPTVFNTGNKFQLRYTFISNNNIVSADGWAIDDFKLTLPKAAIDAGVTTIVTPTDSTITGDDYTVSVIIKNFGTDTLTSIPIEYSVNGGMLNSEIWTGTLYKDSTSTFTFNTQYSAPNQDYALCVYTKLLNDSITNNDKICKQITSIAGAIDAGISEILLPNGQTPIGQQVTVKVTIFNYGTDAISNIPVEYTINGTLNASETYSGTINSNDSVEYTFTTKYTSLIGNYTICVSTDYTGDVDASNDEKCTLIMGTALDIADNTQFLVGQNQPNPASGITKIEFYIPKSGDVSFEIVNMTGSVVESRNEHYSQGKNDITLNPNKYPIGIYYYAVSFEGQRKTFKMVIVR